MLKFHSNETLRGVGHHLAQFPSFVVSERTFSSLTLAVSLNFLSVLLTPAVAVIYCRGWQGLIAQGCHSSILIIDPKTAQTIQVLERHKANVVKVSFLSKIYLFIYFKPICFLVYFSFSATLLVIFS